MTKIGFIGAGRMAFALAKGMEVSELNIFDIASDRVELFQKELNANAKANNKEVVESSDVIFIATKPQHVSDVAQQVKETDKLIISICAGITLEFLEKQLPHARIVRVMPNTPALVQEMAAGYSLGKNVTPEDAKLVNELLNKCGKAVKVEEELLDVVTGLSGSGPAFVARVYEAFMEAGMKQGLSKETAKALTLQTAIGTAKMLEKMTPEELVQMVSTPGGTTEAGRDILEKSDLKEVIGKTIENATERSKEMKK